MLYALRFVVGLDGQKRKETTKTHRIARIACDTMTWNAGRLVILWSSEGVGYQKRTFEHRSKIEVVGASFRREVAVEETRIADND